MTPGLRANGVGYETQGRSLVRGVTLDLDYGEVLAIVGPNGAGKSTLCGLLAGDLEPTGGEAEVCGLPVLETFA